MARKTKEEAEKTREAILDAAVEIFSGKGVTNTSLEEIAKASAVTRGAIYWHFKNKNDIFDALHDRLYQPVTELILQDLEKDHPQPLRQMEELCIQLLLELEHNPQKRQALNLFLIKCNYSGELESYQERHEAQKDENFKLFSRYFEKAKRKHVLAANADPETLTLALSCYMKGILLEYLNNPAGFHIGDRAPKLIALFFAGLYQKP